MTDDLKTLLNERGAVWLPGNSLPLPIHFGAPETEVDAALHGTALFDLSGFRCARIAGGDAERFLHAMLTARFTGMKDHSIRHTAYLSDKGRVLGDAHILRESGPEFTAIADWGQTDSFFEGLDRFVIMDDVEFEAQPGDLAVLGLMGAGATQFIEPWVTAIPEPGCVSTGTVGDWEVVVSRLSEYERPTYWLLVPRTAIVDCITTLLGSGATFAGYHAWQVMRIATGLPEWGRDMGEDTIALEVRLDDAIDFGKGCYPGQEVIERVTSRGQTQWVMAGISSKSPLKAGLELVDADDVAVGQLTSVAPMPDQAWWALARLRRTHAKSGTHLTCGDKPCTVSELPFELP